MAQKRIMTVRFPLGGLHRATGYQFQPPFTFAEGVNVRPRDPFLRRMRGGSRPGLIKAFGDRLGEPGATGTLIGSGTLNVLQQWSRFVMSTPVAAPAFAAADEVNFSTGGTYTVMGREDDDTLLLLGGGSPSGTATVYTNGTIDSAVYTTSTLITVTNLLVDSSWVGRTVVLSTGSTTVVSVVSSNQFTVSGDHSLAAGTAKIHHTVTGSWSSTPYTAETGITVGTSTFSNADVGKLLKFAATGNTYIISRYTLATAVGVWGDATGETNTDDVTVLTAGDPIRMLTPLNVVQWGSTTWLDEFTRAGTTIWDGDWTDATWIAAGLPLMGTLFGTSTKVVSPDSGGVFRAATLNDDLVDDSQPYSVWLDVKPNHSTSGDPDQYQGTFTLFLRMDDSSPDASADGIRVDFAIAAYRQGPLGPWVYSADITLREYASSSLIGSGYASWTSAVQDYMLEVRVVGDIVTVFRNGTIAVNHVAGTAAGSRVGFGLSGTNGAVDTFGLRYFVDGGQTRRTSLCASAGGRLFAENEAGELEDVSGNVRLASDHPLMAVELAGKLYIADYDIEDRLSGDDGTVSSGALTATGVADWRNYNIDINDDVCQIYNSSADGTYKITAIHGSGTNITLSVTGTDPGACSYRICRGPKVYDPDASPALAVLVNDKDGSNNPIGIVPVGCPLIARYRGRIVLGADVRAPHVWYMSRQNTPGDWDYAADAGDVGRAVAGTSTEAGVIAQPLSCIFPLSDDYLVFSAYGACYMLRGDAAAGGTIDLLSDVVGALDAQAISPLPDGGAMMLTASGLYIIRPGVGARPEPVSEGVLPADLSGIETDAVWVFAGWDSTDHGVHLYFTAKTASVPQDFFVDRQTLTFWPMQLQADHKPTAICRYGPAGSSQRKLLLGCQDGYVRMYDYGANDDDGEEMESEVHIGPLLLGGSGYHDGRLDLISATVGLNSGTVTWSVKVGDRHEVIGGADVFMTGSIEAGHNANALIRARGSSAAIILSAVGRWAFEQMELVISRLGRLRVDR